MNEEWKKFGNYEVSNYGRVRRAIGGAGCKAGRIIAQWVQRTHAQVLLWHGGKSKHYFVARLVAICFISDQPVDKPEVNHIDADPLNNRVDNLEWCSRKENAAHAARLGLYRVGEKHGNSKLKDHQAASIRARYANGEKIRALARLYKVSQRCIQFIVRRRTYRHVA